MAKPVNGSPWQLDQCRARVSLPGFAGTIDLARPADGLVNLKGPEGPMVGSRLLGVAIPGFIAGDSQSLIECHRRGADLVVAYRESASWPARLDTRWRVAALPGGLGAIELILSVRTYAPDCRPALAVVTAFRSEEVLAGDEEGSFLAVPPGAEGSTQLGSGRPCCVIFRGAQLSYAQMVHPRDFCRDELLHQPEPIVPVQLHHRLFPQRLEKGVIVRARVAGFLLPRAGDLGLAAVAARQFAASEPPLY